MLTDDEEGDHHRQHRRHHIGREVPVDRRIDAGEEEADEREADQLAEGFVTDV